MVRLTSHCQFEYLEAKQVNIIQCIILSPEYDFPSSVAPSNSYTSPIAGVSMFNAAASQSSYIARFHDVINRYSVWNSFSLCSTRDFQCSFHGLGTKV